MIVGTPQQSHAWFASEATQIVNTAKNAWHGISDAASWIMDRVEQVNQLIELIENNIITKAIRGFNELMTAIQTDISDVLGTIDTLLSAPMEILNSILAIPSSIFDVIESTMSDFKGIYGQALGAFDMIARVDALGEGVGSIGDQLNGLKSAFDLSNVTRGVRTGVASKWLQGGETREQEYQKWEAKASYGQDQAQIMSTQTDIQAAMVKAQNHAVDHMAMAAVDQAARQKAAGDVANAKAAKDLALSAQTVIEVVDF